MTLAAEILAVIAIIGGFFTMHRGGLGLGAAGAILLGFALAGAFKI